MAQHYHLSSWRASPKNIQSDYYRIKDEDQTDGLIDGWMDG